MHKPLAFALFVAGAVPAMAGGLPSHGLPNLEFPPRAAVDTTRACAGPVTGPAGATGPATAGGSCRPAPAQPSPGKG